MQSVAGYRQYVLVWLSLLALALGTFVTSAVLHGAASMLVALTFAVAKAFLVAWFFMHLSHEGAGSRLTFLAAVLFVVLLVSFALGDVLLRPQLPIRTPTPKAPSASQ